MTSNKKLNKLRTLQARQITEMRSGIKGFENGKNYKSHMLKANLFGILFHLIWPEKKRSEKTIIFAETDEEI